ncbi:MAG: DNA methyltransferase [Gaiellaceae bacterium]
MAGVTQETLYEEIDLELSWSERDLPQRQRTKHVHGLHPYLGKFIPQLVEVFLGRYFKAGDIVYDPFCGSGTTLVEANVFGVGAIGCDVSAFNCQLSVAKTADYDIDELREELEQTLGDGMERATASGAKARPSPWLREWYAPRALEELFAYRAALQRLAPPTRAAAELVLTRAARSARMTAHFDLDFPRAPVRGPYLCHKHKRTCTPVGEAAKFLRRYTTDLVRRVDEYADVRTSERVAVIHGDSRTVALSATPSGVITSPPYPGLIDYHEQHRYAYELLGLVDRRIEEIGAAEAGRTRAAKLRYSDSMVAVLENTRRQLPRDAPVAIVVNDSLDLYPAIIKRAGLRLEKRLTRHVNRRTGRRAGQFFESVLVCRT